MAKRTSVKNHIAKNKTLIIGLVVAAVLMIFAIVQSFDDGSLWNKMTDKVSVNDNTAIDDGLFCSHYIDVGQADCELLKCGDDVVLIDGGDVDSYEAIKSYLDSQNVTQIDYFIITHAHADHIGSADEIINNYKISNVIMTKLSEANTPTTAVYRNLLTALSGCDAKIIAAVPGDTYSLPSFSFTVLAPNDDYKELNNTSVVIKANYVNNSFIYQGDAEKESEADILKSSFDVSADVIKLGHHGSNTSSTADYLDAVNPKIAVISCGKDNNYNHPGKDTLVKLNDRGIAYYRTDISGTIVITSDGNNMNAITQGDK